MSLFLYKKKPPGHPDFPLFSFDVYELLGRLRQRLPELSWHQIGVWIQTQPTLACIQHDSSMKAIILHSVLNHRQTPEQVISFILSHELLHLVIPRRKVEGRLTVHPPEFCETELKLLPERELAWSWLHANFGSYLREDKNSECIFVKRGWKTLMGDDRITLGEVAEIYHIDRVSTSAKDNHFL